MKVLNSLFIGCAFVCLASCNAIFEKDISAETPQVIIPSTNDTIYKNEVHFKWEEMEGAREYNLQVVCPSFDDIDEFLLDSMVTTSEFYQIMAPGNYEYRLRGENGGHKSMYTEDLAFYVDSTSNLSDQSVLLISPLNNIYTNGSENITVGWQSLFSAEEYEFILRAGDDFESGSVIDLIAGINGLSYTISSDQFATEDRYHWGILAKNESSNTDYSSRTILVDMTAPNSPESISPEGGVIVSAGDQVIMKWTTGIDPGTINSPLVSSVEISELESFIDFEEFAGITSDSLAYTFTSAGTYWWRVKTDDEAGNFSEFYSEAREVIVE